MNSHRLASGAVAVVCVAVCACTRTKDPAPRVERSTAPVKAAKPTWPRHSAHEGVEFVELFPNGADEDAPLVVAIHGMGDKPDNWVAPWSTFSAPIHVAIPRGFNVYGTGYSWFEFRMGMSGEQFGRMVGDAEDRLWNGIVDLAGAKRLVVTGFSQGGILSFAIAARHPENVVYAFPVAGALPPSLLPRGMQKTAPVVALHGTADTVVAFEQGAGAVEAFRATGNVATMREYRDVGHTMTEAMRADLSAEIARVLPLLRLKRPTHPNLR